jgi:hypothetical protein
VVAALYICREHYQASRWCCFFYHAFDDTKSNSKMLELIWDTNLQSHPRQIKFWILIHILLTNASSFCHLLNTYVLISEGCKCEAHIYTHTWGLALHKGVNIVSNIVESPSNATKCQPLHLKVSTASSKSVNHFVYKGRQKPLGTILQLTTSHSARS